LTRGELLDALPDLGKGLPGDEEFFGGPAVVGQAAGDVVGVNGGGCGTLPEAEVLGAGVRAEKVKGDTGDPGGDAALAAKTGTRAPGLEEGFLGKRESEITVADRKQKEAEEARLVESVDGGHVIERRGRRCAARRQQREIGGFEGFLEHCSGVSTEQTRVVGKRLQGEEENRFPEPSGPRLSGLWPLGVGWLAVVFPVHDDEVVMDGKLVVDAAIRPIVQ